MSGIRRGSGTHLTDSDKQKIRQAMRVPFIAGVALLVMLAAIVLLGTFVPGRVASYLEAALALCMIGTVLLFTMEVREEAPLLRFYALLGFCWLAILVGWTMVDYVTR